MNVEPSDTPPVVDLRRLYWVGPATVTAAVVVVALVQRLSVALLHTVPPPFQFPMYTVEPLVLTAVLVVGGVIVFAVVGDMAVDPVRTYKRIALSVLLVSFVPNFLIANGSYDYWPPAIALATMHVAAWAVTVSMLTRLTTFTKTRWANGTQPKCETTK